MLLASCSTTLPQAPASIATAPDAAFIRGDVAYLASDALEGRESGTRGYVAASDYVASRMDAIGLKPGGASGSWFQPVDLRIKTFGDRTKNVMALSGPNAPVAPFVRDKDYVVTGMGTDADGSISGPLVFVGQAFADPRIGRDDFAGVDLRGKIAVVFSGSPEYIDPEEAAYFNNTRSKRLADAGAIGVITIRSPKDTERTTWEKYLGYFKHYSRATWIDAAGKAEGDYPGYVGSAVLSAEAGDRLLARSGLTVAALEALAKNPKGRFKPFDMGIDGRIDYDMTFEKVTSSNVVGLIEGTDPELRGEYVVLTAHLDHVGIDDPDESGDAIHNGAMDNAVGVATMLDVARRLAVAPPRRSVIFIGLTAEEKGLIGSSYFAQHPTVAKDAIVANVNLDMPTLTFAFTDIIAYGAERSTLFPVLETAMGRAGVTLAKDPHPEEGIFTRSDHYSFVEQGIPSIYLDTGPGNGGEEAFQAFIKEHYHQPSDEIELIDFTQAARFAAINYDIARGIANMIERPVWKKGDFFATVFNGPMADTNSAFATAHKERVEN
ncbi:M28 family metallopeptidase [Croceicoccus sp. BE223]|uniref:M28 family metallopeptidase n=1 Tax=Croceicoccus sp. BE223 TaxID=2817716 RepID=UPI00285E1213|nr:M28 family metallopeptidase [Croceicoccus sp. BE223]MDR7101416.1 hypothetical protein [Croceicoccus sp. BE223]